MPVLPVIGVMSSLSERSIPSTAGDGRASSPLAQGGSSDGADGKSRTGSSPLFAFTAFLFGGPDDGAFVLVAQGLAAWRYSRGDQPPWPGFGLKSRPDRLD
jgi:hypothetical protein